MNICNFCNKRYLRKKDLKNHIPKCSILNNINILGCNEHIFQLLKTVVKENKQLTERVKKLETLSLPVKKKIDIIQWLNDNKENSITFDRFLHNIEITEIDLLNIYDMGIVDGSSNLLKRLLMKMDEKPLLCFERKSYTLYIKGEKGWEIMTDEKFQQCICFLQREILKIFRDNNPVEKLKTDRDHNIYNKRLMKICIENFSVKIKNIRNDLYRNMKININKIIKYDLIF